MRFWGVELTKIIFISVEFSTQIEIQFLLTVELNIAPYCCIFMGNTQHSGTVDSAGCGLVRPLNMKRCGLIGWGWQTTDVCDWDSNGQTNKSMWRSVEHQNLPPIWWENKFERSSSSSFPSCSVDYAHNAGILIKLSLFLLDYLVPQATVSHETRYPKPLLTITSFCLGVFLLPRRLRSAQQNILKLPWWASIASKIRVRLYL